MHTSKYNQKLATKTERMGRLINENRRQIRKTTPSLINAFCLISSMISNRVQLTQSKHKWIAFPSDLAGWHQFTDVCCRQITGCPVQVAQSMLFKTFKLTALQWCKTSVLCFMIGCSTTRSRRTVNYCTRDMDLTTSSVWAPLWGVTAKSSNTSSPVRHSSRISSSYSAYITSNWEMCNMEWRAVSLNVHTYMS